MPVPFLPDQVLQVRKLSFPLTLSLTKCRLHSGTNDLHAQPVFAALADLEAAVMLRGERAGAFPAGCGWGLMTGLLGANFGAQELQEAAESATGQVAVGAEHLQLVLAALRQQQAFIAMACFPATSPPPLHPGSEGGLLVGSS